MQSGLYVGLSAQIALQRRLESLAHNMANVSTVGFRTEELKFETLISRQTADPTAFVSTGGTFLSQKSGEFVKTDNPLDVAVEGNAWLALATPGGTAYTRDGRLRLRETGELQSMTGLPVLDPGGAPILLDASAGPPHIARDGIIMQGTRRVGALGLFTIPAEAALVRFGNSAVIPSLPANPTVDPTVDGVAQGYIERSNVNPVTELSRLITLTRMFDAVSRSMGDQEASAKEAIRVLGPGG